MKKKLALIIIFFITGIITINAQVDIKRTQENYENDNLSQNLVQLKEQGGVKHVTYVNEVVVAENISIEVNDISELPTEIVTMKQLRISPELIENLFPECVYTGLDSKLYIDYKSVTSLLFMAVAQQKEKEEQHRQQTENLQQQLELSQQQQTQTAENLQQANAKINQLQQQIEAINSTIEEMQTQLELAKMRNKLKE